MVDEGRAQYADPTSIIKAAAMLLRHIGYPERAQKLDMALDLCSQYEKRVVCTGRKEGATGADYANYIMETIQDPDVQSKWESYQ